MDYRMEVDADSLTEKPGDRTPEETEESKNEQSASGLTEQMEALDLQSQPEGTSQAKKGKKKRAKGAKGAAANEESKSTEHTGPRTRSRFAAFLAQKKQDEALKKMRIGVVYDELMLMHREHNGDHPERPERVMAIYLNLVKKGLFQQLIRIDSEEAVD